MSERLRLVMQPFATAIFAKARALREITDLRPQHVQRLRESISDDLKKATNFHVHDVSVAAADEARVRGIDLGNQTWHEQQSFDEGRETFLVEHKVPVSSLREACLAAVDEQGVLAVLVGRMRVVWILRSEDDELTRRGFRHKRPDPDEAYRLAGIELVSEKLL